MAAARTDPERARTALGELCRTYWHPLYAFARRTGCSSHEAGDLTQGFFAKLLEKRYLAATDRERGKFRSFLLASFKHFMSHERERARAKKRGGGNVVFSLEAEEGEARYALEPAQNVTTEQIYERRWAPTVLERSLECLQAEYTAAGKGGMFEELRGGLTGEEGISSYAEIGERFGMSEGAVKVAAHRLRRRYRKLLRAEIAETVPSPDEIDEELRHLRGVSPTSRRGRSSTRARPGKKSWRRGRGRCLAAGRSSSWVTAAFAASRLRRPLDGRGSCFCLWPRPWPCRCSCWC